MDQILAIARLAEAADGVAPLDEATLLTLRHHPERAVTWGDHRGFGLLIGEELSVVVAPHERGTGLGKRLLRERPLPPGRISAWSHGDHPAAARLAERHGFERVRELLVMSLDARDLPTDPVAPGEGARLAAYSPQWEGELLRVNAAAFASHPEQGALDADGLRLRMAEPWFEPEGLILAVEGERLLGFHWTKRHSPQLGEVYVVGIDPGAQGRGLGKVLTVAGLRHLGDVGVERVILYVESDNHPARRLYEGLGFTRSETHVQYVRA